MRTEEAAFSGGASFQPREFHISKCIFGFGHNDAIEANFNSKMPQRVYQTLANSTLAFFFEAKIFVTAP